MGTGFGFAKKLAMSAEYSYNHTRNMCRSSSSSCTGGLVQRSVTGFMVVSVKRAECLRPP